MISKIHTSLFLVKLSVSAVSIQALKEETSEHFVPGFMVAVDHEVGQPEFISVLLKMIRSSKIPEPRFFFPCDFWLPFGHWCSPDVQNGSFPPDDRSNTTTGMLQPIVMIQATPHGPRNVLFCFPFSMLPASNKNSQKKGFCQGTNTMYHGNHV